MGISSRRYDTPERGDDTGYLSVLDNLFHGGFDFDTAGWIKFWVNSSCRRYFVDGIVAEREVEERGMGGWGSDTGEDRGGGDGWTKIGCSCKGPLRT